MKKPLQGGGRLGKSTVKSKEGNLNFYVSFSEGMVGGHMGKES